MYKLDAEKKATRMGSDAHIDELSKILIKFDI